MAKPRRCSLVRFIDNTIDEPRLSNNRPVVYMPFIPGHIYVFLGEIPNMDGHCIIADYVTGNIYCGYPTDIFKEIPEEEMMIDDNINMVQIKSTFAEIDVESKDK